jgi:predicted anti-sigma-YlaC factor YlaD
MTRSASIPLLLLALAGSGCSLKTYAINMVGNALASGDSVYETDDDLDLVVAALPFGLKLTESLLAQSPEHPGLLLTACRGYVLYTYANVHYEAQLSAERDLDRARAGRARARRLYTRANGYCMRGLERAYPGLADALLKDPRTAVTRISLKNQARDLPFLYWTAASLGLAISVSTDDAAMLAQLPAVHALLDRALALDDAWDEGTLHEFKVLLAGSDGTAPEVSLVRKHYERAVQLSRGRSAGVHVAYAEAVSVRQQNRAEFNELLTRALAIDPDAVPANRLVTILAHRRARWLADRVDELFIDGGSLHPPGR